MRKLARGVLTGSAAIAVVAAALAQNPAAAAPASDAPGAAVAQRPDNLPGPLTARQEAWRKQATSLLAAGKAKIEKRGTSSVVKLADGKYVEYPTEKTDNIFTILADFGSQSVRKLGSTPGPVHNTIAEPDRSVNNSTKWRADFNTAYYKDLFFDANGDGGESFKDFYKKLSSGRYDVNGDVSDWVTVPYNGSYYGDNTVENSGGAWAFVADSANAWYNAQVAAGKTKAEIQAYLAQFDVWDRNDYDHDGNFNEPDGYVDHFQAIHAGEGEDAGGGVLGEDAIWSHRWYVNGNDYGLTGPTVGGNQVLFGGTPLGDSGLWIGDYTTEPENGGLGVFSHEYGHDLGLPDYYDTNSGENGTGFWTLMSSGSWLGRGIDSIGDTPGNWGPYEKMNLGWLDYATAGAGANGSYTLGEAARTTDGAKQAVAVTLPDKTTSTSYTTPTSGQYAWWTGSADNLNVTLTRELDLTGISRATVTTKAWYDIEKGYDYLYGETSTNGGQTWTKVGAAVDGSSSGRWSTLRYDVKGGGKVLFRFRYATDGGVHLSGAFLDDILVKSGGTTLFSDDVESGTNGWTASGLKRSTGTETQTTPQFYLVENRTYTDYDAVLQTGPYNWAKGITAPDWVEHFPYQDGLLVWYVDLAYADNNTSVHPGHGLSLPVDARPQQFGYSDGTVLSNRRLPFDATFGLEATDAVTLHKEVLQGSGPNQQVVTLTADIPSRPGIPTFDDTNVDGYYLATNPQASTKVAGHGTQVTVTGQSAGTMTITVVNP